MAYSEIDISKTKKLIDQQRPSSLKEVFLIKKCTNFNDGNGAMVPFMICDTYQTAESYVNRQPGIQGMSQPLPTKYKHTPETWYFSGYEITRFEVFTHDDIVDKVRLQTEIQDLEDRLRKLKAKI